MLGIGATVDTLRVNIIGLCHDQNTQHVARQRGPNKNRNHTTCVARELAQRNKRYT